MKDLYVFEIKWPLAAYYCCNCSCYLMYRYQMWAKGKCHQLSGITSPLFRLLSPLLRNSQVQNINEVLQMPCPAISFCALFSPFVTWNARSWMVRKHTQQEHGLCYQGCAVLGDELLPMELHLPQNDKSIPEVLGRFSYPQAHTVVSSKADALDTVLCHDHAP